MDVFWEAAVCSLVDSALIMDAVSFSETSVSIYQTTRCYIPKDNHDHICRREHQISQVPTCRHKGKVLTR
jgi:hypothetical protein